MIYIKTLNIDIETYSDIDLLKTGVYRYVDSPNFEVLMMAYSIDGQEEQIIDLSQEQIPNELHEAIYDPSVLKIAFNAQFERVCLDKHFLGESDPAQWHCTAVHASELGLPRSLKQCALFLRIEEQKDTAGTQLINYFSKPCKPTKANGMRTRNLPEHDPEKWELFKSYCIQDVVVEKAIANRLSVFPVAQSEWKHYCLDQKINDYGVMVDAELAKGAISIMDTITAENVEKLKTITGLDNPNSPKQLKEWLLSKGHDFPTLGKDIVKAYIQQGIVKDDVAEALKLRLKLSNSSTKKYLMMENVRCTDGRLHGLVQFYGASRTGRWAGRLLQVQNLPRNKMEELDIAREMVKQQDIEGLDLVFGNVPDVLKQLIRTGLVAKEGYTFHVSDFNSIEARVLAWFAGEKWVLDVFRDHGKIYEATASQMFNVPLDQVDSELRQKGKVSTLALGYQGSVGALIAMGAIDMGLEEQELKPMVDGWRRANKKIVSFWYDVQRAAISAIENKGVIRMSKGLRFFHKKGFLFIQLPSGRHLSYARARLEEGDYGPKIVYEGQGDKVGFSTLDTYGGKLVENIVQATARDILAEAMQRLDEYGYNIVFHVHDEAVAEVPKGVHTIEEMNEIMSVVPRWAEGLPLGAEGYETDYYKKD